MTVRYSIKDRTLFVTVQGDYQLRDFYQALVYAVLESSFVAPMQLFIDARQTAVKPTPQAIRDLAYRIDLIKKYFCPDWILVVSSPFYYGLSRMFAAFVESYGIRIHIYRNLDTAQEAAQKFRAQKTME